VLEEGIPREAIQGPDAATLSADWTRVVQQAEDVLAGFASPAAETPSAEGLAITRLAITRLAMTRLVVVAAAVSAMARASGLDAAIAAGAFPELAALRSALDAAYAFRRAR